MGEVKTEIQRYRGVSWNPRAHTGQVSAETRRWKVVRDPDGFLLSHSCSLPLPSFFPFICPSRLLPLWHTKTFHVFTSRRRKPPLPGSCLLGSCAQHSLLEHLPISVPVCCEGAWGGAEGQPGPTYHGQCVQHLPVWLRQGRSLRKGSVSPADTSGGAWRTDPKASHPRPLLSLESPSFGRLTLPQVP